MNQLDGSFTRAADSLAKLSPDEWIDRIQAALAQFSSETRLYDVQIDECAAPLTVEGFIQTESVCAINELTMLVLSTDAYLPIHDWLGRPCRLRIRLAEGGEAITSGLIRAAHCVNADAGLARYRLSVVSWWWQLTQQVHCRVFQDKTVLQIIEQVLADYAAAHWRVSAEVAATLAALPQSVRPYTVQYRESDWTFIQRLTAEIGLGLCASEQPDAPGGSLLIFADSRAWPEDPSSQAHGGIRFHRSHSQEQSDAVQAFGHCWQLHAAASTTLTYQAQTKRAVTGSSTSVALADGTPWPAATAREQYRYSTRHASQAQAQHAMTLGRQTTEAQTRHWLGRASVRSLRVGSWFALTDSPLSAAGDAPANAAPAFAVLRIERLGLNNLPTPTQRTLAALFGSTWQALQPDPAAASASDPWPTALLKDAALVKQARQTGFAMRLQALQRDQRWLPALSPKPAAPGQLTAQVTGPGGALQATGTDELWIDAQGRIQVRFFFQQGAQPDDTHTVWLRLRQSQAGAGLGMQFMPRIGQEVAVGFVQGDIDCPLVLGSLYNGRGEGGFAPTPAGQQQAPLAIDTTVLERSGDQRPAAQANLSGGHSPAWHGAAPGAQRNAAGLSGFKDAALGAANPGFNQLVFDDADDQLRVQLRSSHLGSELSLGHLIHQADNHRGSVKGAGFELRTDGYLALRATQGVLLTTYAQPLMQPVGDLVPGLALARQADTLLTTFARAAHIHQALPMAADRGSLKAHRSVQNAQAAPWPALQISLQGLVSNQQLSPALQDAAKRNTQLNPQQLPHLVDPLIVLTAKASCLAVTGQQQVEIAGDTLHLATGQDHTAQQGSHYLRHTGQALSILSGVIKPGAGNVGLQAIAAHDALTVQAQAGPLQLFAQQTVTLGSQQQAVTLAAPTTLHLKTQAGARLSLTNGNIEVHAPGVLTIHRATLRQLPPEKMSYALPQFAHSTFILLRKSRFTFSG